MYLESHGRSATPSFQLAPSKREEMAGVNTEYIIAIALGSLLVTLLLVFMCLLCVFLRKKRALCFRDRRGYEQQRPFVIPDKTLYGKKQRRRKGGSSGKGAKGKPVKYSRIGQQSPNLRQPRGDPFAHNYLEDPMLDEEAMGEDWSNPLFDAEHSQKRDAAIHIQSWFRMIRYYTNIFSHPGISKLKFLFQQSKDTVLTAKGCCHPLPSKSHLAPMEY